MTKPVIILDAGHGGVVNGEYQTSGKRSPEFDEGLGVLYEGEFNRAVCEYTKEFLNDLGIPYIYLDTNLDIPLLARTRYMEFISSGMTSIVISVHANAASSPDARGVEVFTTPGDSKSDDVAEIWFQEYEKEFDHKMRADKTDGDHDKEAKFQIIAGTRYPAILIEHPFMTNKEDYYLLWSDEYRWRAAKVIANTVQRAINELYA